jgi:hypothetical protein
VLLSSCGGVTPTGPTINSFTSDVETIEEGESVVLSWSVTNATSISINPTVGVVTDTPTGSYTVTPTETTTYILTATNSSGSTTKQIIITVGTGMEEAVRIVIEDILPDIPEIKTGGPYVCLKLESPLSPGTIIEEDGPTTTKQAARVILNEESYFFYLDLAPRTYYAHPVKYLLVDENGEYQEFDAQWWPKINNKIPEIITEDIPEEDDVIASNITFIKPIGKLVDYPFFPIYSQYKEGFIVVQGLMNDEGLFDDATYTYLNGISFFSSYKNDISRVEGLVQNDARQVLDIIDDMASEGRGVITIYIIAHGGIDVIRLGGEYFTATQFYNKMAEYPLITFNFILGSCHSGSFVNDFWNLDNVSVITTACADDEGAAPDWDYSGSYSDTNPTDVGSEWTSSLIEAMKLIVNNSDRMGTIQNIASNYDVPVTSVLICEASFGAVGVNPGLGLSTDYDFTHLLGNTSPRHFCSWETLF